MDRACRSPQVDPIYPCGNNQQNSMSANPDREIKEKKRRERLAASLRENLKRRKLQSRDRAARDKAEPASPSDRKS
jgi:hypothetical protein